MTLSLDQQVEQLMQKTLFGDAQTAQVMAQELRSRLAEQRPLRVYLGVDPTAPDLHLGHSVPLQKLALFQSLGHQCFLLIGDFTARLGDPSDKDKTRPQLSPAQIRANVQTYRDQAFKLLDSEQTTLCYNSEWLDGLTTEKILQLSSQFTVAQFLARDNFAKRFAKGNPIHLHEFFYTLMQGYDALALQADIQLGGTDQTFNILAGRRLQEVNGQKPQVMLTNPMLPGTDGQKKMSKSLKNAIPVTAKPTDLYGQLMSIPDTVMRIYFDLLTNFSPAEIDQIFAELAAGQRHPRDLKMLLARQITTLLSSEAQAAQAEAQFVALFQQRRLPTTMPQHTIQECVPIIDLLVALNLAASKSAARRLIQQGGVRIDDTRISDTAMMIEPHQKMRVLRVGKRHFVTLL